MQPCKFAKRPYWILCSGTVISAFALGKNFVRKLRTQVLRREMYILRRKTYISRRKIKNIHRQDDDVGVARRVS